MLHTVKEHEFMGLMLSKERFREERISDAPHAYAMLFTYWAARLKHTQIVALGFILHRTLVEGKTAARIPSHEIEAALSTSRNTIRDHLMGLCEADLIHVYRTARADGSETEARMYEINFKKVAKRDPNSDEIDLEAAKKLVFGGSTSDGGGSKSDPPFMSNTITQISKTETSFCIPLGSSRSQGGKVIPIPKKVRATAGRSDSAASVIAAVQAKAASAQTARVASATRKAAHLVTKPELQAMFDKAQRTYAPDAVRVIVTGKEFGLLRKRMKEQPPRDLEAFVSWTVRYWGNIAQQHAKAIQRNESRLERGERAIPASMDFASLAYRYPYFLKAHANFNAERTTAEQTAETDKRVERLKAQLAQKDQDIQVLRRTAIRRTRPEPEPARPAPAVRRTRPSAALDDEIPEWTPADQRKRHA